MTNEEFSNEFDVLYNSITSNQAPGLDEYEKSVFLTKAQYQVLKGYLTSRGNTHQEGFDESRKRQIDFSQLYRVADPEQITPDCKFDNRSLCYRAPKDLFIPINEKVSSSTKNYVVEPISFAEYDRLMSKPYQYPVKRHVWRLMTNQTPGILWTPSGSQQGKTVRLVNPTNKTVILDIRIISNSETASTVRIDTEDTVTLIINRPVGYLSTLLNSPDPVKDILMTVVGNSVEDFFSLYINTSEVVKVLPDNFNIELIGRIPDDVKYTIRYIKKPAPIIIENLPENLSIEGVSTKSECELDEELHSEILQRAVELAKAAYTGDLQSQIALGQTSQTELGIVPQQR